MWRDEPLLHLLPHWNWTGMAVREIPVYVYTNCESAELFVNGESAGVKNKEKGIYRLVWEDVVYELGSIRAVGLDSDGNVLADQPDQHFL